MKHHSVLGNIYLLSKYTLPFQGNAFANKHVPTDMTGATIEELCFLCGPYRGVISETRFRAESVEVAWRRVRIFPP
jgi:hypothetical protein